MVGEGYLIGGVHHQIRRVKGEVTNGDLMLPVVGMTLEGKCGGDHAPEHPRHDSTAVQGH